MTDTDIVTRLAREAGMYDVFKDGTRWQSETGGPSVDIADLSRFAALVAESCVGICYDHAFGKPGTWPPGKEAGQAIGRIIEDIRARFVHSPKP